MIVLKDVMDGKGKRLEINVRPVLAAEFQIILEVLEGRKVRVMERKINQWMRH